MESHAKAQRRKEWGFAIRAFYAREGLCARERGIVGDAAFSKIFSRVILFYIVRGF